MVFLALILVIAATAVIYFVVGVRASAAVWVGTASLLILGVLVLTTPDSPDRG